MTRIDNAEVAFHKVLEAEQQMHPVDAWDRLAAALKLEPNNPEIVTAAGRIASRCFRYDDAESLLSRALESQEAAHGPDHVFIATILHNLAELYVAQRREEEAIPLYKRGLAILENAHGQEHPDVADMLVNLGYAYKIHDQLTEAEAVYRKALAIQEAARGVGHEEVDSNLNRLRYLYEAMDRRDKTEALLQHYLNARENAFGPESETLVRLLEGLAGLCCHQKRVDEAVELSERALAITIKNRGIDNRSADDSYRNLARLYEWELNDNKAAETLYRRFLADRERTLGPDHQMVAEVLLSLAELSQRNRRPRKAIAHYERALAIFEKTFGPDDLRVSAVLVELADIYKKRWRGKKAAKLYWRVFAIHEQIYWIGHSQISRTLNELRSYCKTSDDLKLVEAHFKRHFEARERQFRADH